MGFIVLMGIIFGLTVLAVKIVSACFAIPFVFLTAVGIFTVVIYLLTVIFLVSFTIYLLAEKNKK